MKICQMDHLIGTMDTTPPSEDTALQEIQQRLQQCESEKYECQGKLNQLEEQKKNEVEHYRRRYEDCLEEKNKYEERLTILQKFANAAKPRDSSNAVCPSTSLPLLENLEETCQDPIIEHMENDQTPTENPSSEPQESLEMTNKRKKTELDNDDTVSEECESCEGLKKQNSKLSKTFEKFRIDMTKKKEHLEQDIKKCQDDLKISRNNEDKHLQQLNGYREEINNLKAQLATCETKEEIFEECSSEFSNASLIKELEEGRKQNASLIKELEEYRKQNASLIKDLEECRKQNNLLKQELENDKHQNNSLKQEIEVSTHQNKSLNEKLMNLTHQNKSLNEKFEDYQKEIAQLQEKHRMALSEHDNTQIRNQLLTLTTQLNECRSENNTLKESEKRYLQTCHTQQDEYNGKINELKEQLSTEAHKHTVQVTELEMKLTEVEARLSQELQKSLNEQEKEALSCDELEYNSLKEIQDEFESFANELQSNNDCTLNLAEELNASPPFVNTCIRTYNVRPLDKIKRHINLLNETIQKLSNEKRDMVMELNNLEEFTQKNSRQSELIEELTNALDDKIKDIEAKDDQIYKCKDENNKLVQRIEGLQKQYDEISLNVQGERISLNTKYDTENKALSDEILRLTKELKMKKNKHKNKIKDYEQKLSAEIEKNKSNEKNQLRIEQLEKNIRELQKEYELENEKIMTEHQKTTQTLKNSLQSKDIEIQDYRKHIRQLKEENSLKGDHLLHTYQDQLENQKSTILQLENTITYYKQKENELHFCQETIGKVEKQCQSLREFLHEIDVTPDNFADKIQSKYGEFTQSFEQVKEIATAMSIAHYENFMDGFHQRLNHYKILENGLNEIFTNIPEHWIESIKNTYKQLNDWKNNYQKWLKILKLPKDTVVLAFNQVLKRCMNKTETTKKDIVRKAKLLAKKANRKNDRSPTKKAIEKIPDEVPMEEIPKKKVFKRKLDDPGDDLLRFPEKMYKTGGWTTLELTNLVYAIFKLYFTLEFHMKAYSTIPQNILENIEKKIKIIMSINENMGKNINDSIYDVYSRYVMCDINNMVKKENYSMYSSLVNKDKLLNACVEDTKKYLNELFVPISIQRDMDRNDLNRMDE